MYSLCHRIKGSAPRHHRRTQHPGTRDHGPGKHEKKKDPMKNRAVRLTEQFSLLLLYYSHTTYMPHRELDKLNSRMNAPSISRLKLLVVLLATATDAWQLPTREQLTQRVAKVAAQTVLGISLSATALIPNQAAWAAADPNAIVGCLFQKCATPLAKCIGNPKCLANVVCINTCNNRPDEIECQIKCGDLFENEVVGEFNKCAVSDMACVPQQQDDGRYPVPSSDKVVSSFSTSLFNGRWYITAGQNPLFDTFPCQVHFFTETEPGKFFGKLNWRIEEPDGEFFTKDALQEFVQDPQQPAHLINHDNEYLHYKDDWWIIDYEPDNDKGIPPFAFVYYRGSNDAWDGYGGAVIYTRDAALPKELIPRLEIAAKKVGFDFKKDFALTDNSCPTELSASEKVLLREKFAGKVLLQTEEQLRAQSTRFRGNAANSVKAQKLFFDNRAGQADKAYKELKESTNDFEREVLGK